MNQVIAVVKGEARAGVLQSQRGCARADHTGPKDVGWSDLSVKKKKKDVVDGRRNSGLFGLSFSQFIGDIFVLVPVRLLFRFK